MSLLPMLQSLMRESGPELKGDWNQEAEIEAEAMKECCLLACSQDHHHKSGTTHNGLDPPVSISNQENDL